MRMDPQTAPVLGACPRCGGEIYQREELERHDGVCADCAAEMRREKLAAAE